MKKTYKKYPLNQSCLYQLRSKKKLSEILGIDLSILKNKKYKNMIKYSNFVNEKGRIINNPDDKLKKVQKKLLNYLCKIETPLYLISGQKGISYLDNAKKHIAKQRYIVTSDIAGFYKNCKRKHIYIMLREKFKMSEDVAGIITDFVCCDDYVPTGSPTSQIIAFLTYSEIFDKINQLAQEKKNIFTLYVDDMTFSSEKYISRKILYQIELELRRKGLKFKTKKTKKYNKKENCLITGVAIDKNGNLKVPNKLRSSIIKNLREYKRTKEEKIFLKLRGKLEAARMIEKDIFPSLKNLKI